MPATDTAAALDQIAELIVEVKPGLADTTVKPTDALVDDLGLDSLDILQLSRKINRDLGVFDL
ncbi:MAG: acyl carrier protein, partial [Catenulispora sp.]|nr:acyl carrier protein [Catenulispora sp.]